MTFETRDVVEPEPAVLLCPLRHFFEALGLELIDALAAFFSLANESRAPQNAEVLRDRWPTDPETCGELRYRGAALPQAIEDRAPSGVGDGIEYICVGRGARHRSPENR